jgi:hypothetical protein
MTAGYKWKPLRRAAALPASEALVAVWMKHHGTMDRAEVLRLMAEEQARVELWRNDLYQVEVRRYPEIEHVHLNIRRLDGFPGRDWRHFQQIKNELVGPECEGIELYPAESRLTDTSNKYHIWVSTDPTFRFPFGFGKRDVQFGDHSEGGLRQRPPMKVRS